MDKNQYSYILLLEKDDVINLLQDSLSNGDISTIQYIVDHCSVKYNIDFLVDLYVGAFLNAHLNTNQILDYFISYFSSFSQDIQENLFYSLLQAGAASFNIKNDVLDKLLLLNKPLGLAAIEEALLISSKFSHQEHLKYFIDLYIKDYPDELPNAFTLLFSQTIHYIHETDSNDECLNIIINHPDFHLAFPLLEKKNQNFFQKIFNAHFKSFEKIINHKSLFHIIEQKFTYCEMLDSFIFSNKLFNSNDSVSPQFVCFLEFIVSKLYNKDNQSNKNNQTNKDLDPLFIHMLNRDNNKNIKIIWDKLLLNQDLSYSLNSLQNTEYKKQKNKI